jgi:hypothetical protein
LPEREKVEGAKAGGNAGFRLGHGARTNSAVVPANAGGDELMEFAQ